MMAHHVKTLLLISVCVLLASCGGQKAKQNEGITFVDPPRREGTEAVLVMLPANSASAEVRQGLLESVGEEYDIVTRVVGGKVTADDINTAMTEVSPAAVVLLNNATIKAYKAWQKTQGDDKEFPPAMLLMASYLKEFAGDVQAATGIVYEIPSVSIFSNLRKLVKHEVKRVGVLHRPNLKTFIEGQQKLAAIEKFELVAVEMPADPDAREVRRAVRRLSKEVDALWVLNDNGLLTSKMLTKAWVPGLRRNTLPVVVGVKALVAEQAVLGTFAVLPDHMEMGLQAGNMLLEIADEDWTTEGGFEQPIAVKTVMHVGFARDHLGLIEDRKDRINVLVGQ